MSLEENWRYTSIAGDKVHIKRKVDDIIFHFSDKIIELLGIEKLLYEEQIEILNKNNVLVWLTDNSVMPAWRWHKESWKCIGWNTGWLAGHCEKYDRLIEGFDIKLETEFNISSNSENYIEAWLSNLARYPFDLNWIPYASIEAFWQSLKFEEWSSKWLECLELFWVESKKIWNKTPPKEYFIYNWNTYKVWSKPHQQLMKLALREQLKQNHNKLKLLLLTGKSKLIHKPRKKDWSLYPDSITIPGEIFSQFLMELREEFKPSEHLKTWF